MRMLQTDADANIRSDAADALGCIGRNSEDVVPLLAKMLGCGKLEDKIRASAAQASTAKHRTAKHRSQYSATQPQHSATQHGTPCHSTCLAPPQCPKQRGKTKTNGNEHKYTSLGMVSGYWGVHVLLSSLWRWCSAVAQRQAAYFCLCVWMSIYVYARMFVYRSVGPPIHWGLFGALA